MTVKETAGGSASFATLAQGARAVLDCADPDGKARLGHEVAALWRKGVLSLASPATVAMPDRPSRPSQPRLLSPNEMPRRTFTGARGRFALLHSLAHIELNAIDLAFDMVGRWADADMPRAFFDDWIKVGDEEAKHFEALQGRLAAMGGRYGDLPAHDGLWQAAEETRHDLFARLAIVPMVLEARGLDVTPMMIERLIGAGDHESVAVLTMIYHDEKQHVGAGARWFGYLCTGHGVSPEATFHALVRKHFRGLLKAPFNAEARTQAGIAPGFYEPLTSR